MIAVDPDARQLTLDRHGEAVMLDADFLDDRTAHGDPTLRHGYAITAHVAQGVTVDRGFVLVGPGLDRELAYTALSRGRHANHLYASRDPENSRDEFAPADRHRSDPLARLATALATSSANSLAIDTGRAEPTTADRLEYAERCHAQAVTRRRAHEAGRGNWLPGRRRALEQLRHAEAIPARPVRDLSRERLELLHGARPFVTERERDASFAKTLDLVVERRLDRERNRELGHGLERCARRASRDRRHRAQAQAGVARRPDT